MVNAQQLEKIRSSSVKIGERRTLGTKVHIFHRLGIQQQQSIVDEIFLYSAQEELSINILIDNDNPIVDSDMVSKSILVHLNFG